MLVAVVVDNLKSRKPCVLPHPKRCGCFGFLDDPKLKQVNLKRPHPKGYGFNLWT